MQPIRAAVLQQVVENSAGVCMVVKAPSGYRYGTNLITIRTKTQKHAADIDEISPSCVGLVSELRRAEKLEIYMKRKKSKLCCTGLVVVCTGKSFVKESCPNFFERWEIAEILAGNRMAD